MYELAVALDWRWYERERVGAYALSWGGHGIAGPLLSEEIETMDDVIACAVITGSLKVLELILQRDPTQSIALEDIRLRVNVPRHVDFGELRLGCVMAVQVPRFMRYIQTGIVRVRYYNGSMLGRTERLRLEESFRQIAEEARVCIVGTQIGK